jgi:DNA polymerase-3 subunit gamma/tau
VPFDPAVLPLVVRAGGGSARDTLSILDQLLAGSDEEGIKYDRAVALLGYTDASLLDEMVDAFAARDGAAVFRAVNRVIEGGHEPRRFATDTLDRFRDLIVLASVPDAISTGLLDVPPDRAEALRGQAERYGLASLTRAADIVATGLDQMRGATSPRLLLELMCAQVLLPAAATDERSLLARLEMLEAGAAAVASSVPVASGTGNAHPERERPTHQPQPSAEGGAASATAQPVPPTTTAQQPGPAHPARPAGETPAPPAAAPQAAQQPGESGQPAPAQRQAPVQPPASGGPAASQRPAPAFTHAPGAQGAAAAPATSRGGDVTLDALRQAWPNVVEAIKAKGRVAAIVIGNASVASFDEGVLTLRFPRQGDVKGFQGSKYEELLKQAINAMFGVNVVIRAVTGGGDAPSPGRRQGPGPGPAPAAPPAQSPSGQPSSSSHGQPPSGQPPADPPPPDYPPQNGQANHPGPGAAAAVTAGHAGGSAANGGGGGTNSFGSPVMSGGGDLPPLPQPPPPDDEDFDPDDEDMSSSTTVNDLTGMALVQRELGAQIIAEYDD